MTVSLSFLSVCFALTVIVVNCELSCRIYTLKDRRQICSLPKDSRSCLRFQSRYYYNFSTGKCEKFSFGGCDGNLNHFTKLSQCNTFCRNAFLDKGRRIMLTCQKVGNNHEKMKILKCTQRSKSEKKKDGTGKSKLIPKKDEESKFTIDYKIVNLNMTKVSHINSTKSICQLPMEPGACRAAFPSYYHNRKTKKCELFYYGGCGGNANRFAALEECEEKCVTRNSGIDEQNNKKDMPYKYIQCTYIKVSGTENSPKNQKDNGEDQD